MFFYGGVDLWFSNYGALYAFLYGFFSENLREKLDALEGNSELYWRHLLHLFKIV